MKRSSRVGNLAKIYSTSTPHSPIAISKAPNQASGRLMRFTPVVSSQPPSARPARNTVSMIANENTAFMVKIASSRVHTTW